MIGHTAGVGDEYKEAEQPQVWNPLMQMKGMFSGALDMNQLNSIMQNAGYFMNGMPVQPQQPAYAPPTAPPTAPTPAPTPASAAVPTSEAPKEEEAPPGMDDDEEEAPPGL